jgi:hypothetical protein
VPDVRADAAPASTDDGADTWLTPALRLVAVTLPFMMAVARAASSGQWRGDLPLVRDVGLVAVGLGGGLSTPITQALTLLPLGCKAFRAALGAALALALATWLLHSIAHRVLAAAGTTPRLRAALAALAAATAGLSPTWQREATVGGGAMVATAAALAVLLVGLDLGSAASGPPAPRARIWIALGALCGATFAESPPASVAAAAALALALVGERTFANAQDMVERIWRGAAASARRAEPAPVLPRGRILAVACAAAVLVAAALLAPLLLRPLAPRAWVDIGRALSASSLSALDVVSARTTALGAWVGEVGVVSLAVATFGVVVALVRPRARPLALPLLALVLADTVAPARLAGMLSADPLTSLRSLAVGALAVLSALGVAGAVVALMRARMPMARSAAVLTVVFHLTMVALASEEASFAADRSDQFAAEQWTDEAYLGLEPSAAVLVRSPAVAWRLWAARVTRGERPDVLVIPVPLLDRGRVSSSLVAAERQLEPLLHAYALRGRATEFALSKLADVRPLHVEIDGGWSDRLLAHLSVDGMWLEYAPQPLGPSDRKQAALASTAPLRRVLASIHASPVPDAPTASVVAVTLREQAAVLSQLGERETAYTFVQRVADLSPTDPLSGGGAVGFAFVGVRRAVAGPMARR